MASRNFEIVVVGGLLFLILIVAMAKFYIVMSECEAAGEAKCITKALREMNGNGRNISVDN